MRGSVLILSTVLCVYTATDCSASVYNVNVTNAAIYGSGNSNGGFAVDQGSSVEVGLRAHRRYPTPLDTPAGIMHQGMGVYGSFEAEGYTSGGATGGPRGSWNFDWSINSSYDGLGTNLNSLTYLLEIDYNPSQGTNFLPFDPVNVSYADHSFGTNATLDNQGTEAPLGDTTAYGNLLSSSNLVQNSWNLEFFSGPQAFDPTADATYTIRLSAFRSGLLLADTSIDVIVGEGGAPIPEPLSFLAWGGLIGCALVASRRHQRS